ncbi:hypothetical protein [Aeromicrobium sp. HA]|uniref:hypothetical protein n=1 Tax=Aeromicrobium sp. HA TaxID=3009077 RepID=UPI0022AEBBCC|nr:hypothetical protein [Aeromicrobium sp. HA]
MAHFNLVDLDSATRHVMLEELESDVSAARVYTSRRALAGTDDIYFDAQRAAFDSGDTESLTHELATSGLFAAQQSDGKIVNVVAAAEALADGQFVAYYTRAVCRRAIDEGRAIEVYRGQETAEHRAASDALIGTRPDPAMLLRELRDFSLEPWKFSGVGKVNSGLAVQFI